MYTRVLVLGVGGNISQGILKALALSKLPVKVYVACIDPLSVGLYMGKLEGTFICPRADNPDFEAWLVRIIQEHNINIVFSGGEEILEVLSKISYYIKDRTGAICIVSPKDIYDIGHDKLRTCQWLEGQGLPYPPYSEAKNWDRIDDLIDRWGMPLIAKPRVSRNSKNIKVLIDTDEPYLQSEDYVIQKLIGDDNEEYTVGCFSSQYGILKNIIVFRRILKDGTTYVAQAGEFPQVRDAAAEVVNRLKPIGPCNLQMRMHEGRPTAFEFNIRYSSSTPMRARMGFNDVAAAVKHFAYGDQGDLGLNPATQGYALRYLNEVYIPAEGKRPGIVEDWGI